MAVVADEPIADERTETAKAIKGYRDALTYIGQAAHDPHFDFNKQFLKSLHFMMVGHDMSKYPGQWRPGSIFVVSTKTGDTVYSAPDIESVPGLIDELVDYLKCKDNDPPIIKGAMAHLNLTMIHPFKDGNGRMARALQTLVIALGDTMYPAFSSIEEWLGEHTQDYYDVLALVGKGVWSPQGSARAWIRFCLKAHYQQAATLIRRNDEYERLYERISEIALRKALPERSSLALFDAALGFRLTNKRYRTDTDLSEVSASRDLKKLCDIGLLEPQGEKRGRFYRPGRELTEARRTTRSPRLLSDPYELVKPILQPKLPGL